MDDKAVENIYNQAAAELGYYIDLPLSDVETDPLLLPDGLASESDQNEGDFAYREEPEHLQELRYSGQVPGLR